MTETVIIAQLYRWGQLGQPGHFLREKDYMFPHERTDIFQGEIGEKVTVATMIAVIGTGKGFVILTETKSGGEITTEVLGNGSRTRKDILMTGIEGHTEGKGYNDSITLIHSYWSLQTRFAYSTLWYDFTACPKSSLGQ